MAPKVNTITATAITNRKAMLERKREELWDSSRDREAILIEPNSDPADRVRSGTEVEIAVQRLDVGTRLSHDIELALSKIQKNTYGACERCEAAISPKRLDAVPWARLCLTCQSEAESAERAPMPHLDKAA